jgi:hypothetical protein
MGSITRLLMIRSLQNYFDMKRISGLGRRATAWLYEHEASFRISRTNRDAIPWQVKPLAELMLLLVVMERHGVRNKLLNCLGAIALAEGNGFDWHELAAYDPSAATGMALVADFYRTLKRSAPFDDRFFLFLNQIGYFEGMDRLPYRDMDLAYNLGRVVSAHYEKDLPRWFASTAFGRRQHIVRYTIDDIYSLTHAVFYLTDLGLRPVESLLDAETAGRLRAELSTLTAAILRADNTDVLGELLLCWMFCDVERNSLNQAILDHAIYQMTAAMTKDGAVAPSARIFRQAGEGRATFKQLYHTTLVGAFLFTLLTETDLYAIN